MNSPLVNKASALKAYLLLVADLPRLDEAEQEVLEQGALNGDPASIRALTESFLGLVVAEANALRGRGRRFEALIAAGNRGLALALRGTDGPLRVRVRSGVRRQLHAALAKPRSKAA